MSSWNVKYKPLKHSFNFLPPLLANLSSWFIFVSSAQYHGIATIYGKFECGLQFWKYLFWSSRLSITSTHSPLVSLSSFIHTFKLLICAILCLFPQYLELFFNVSYASGQQNFLIFCLLIPYIHREGTLGQQARDALLLIMAASARNQVIGKYIANNSDFCPVSIHIYQTHQNLEWMKIYIPVVCVWNSIFSVYMKCYEVRTNAKCYV